MRNPYSRYLHLLYDQNGPVGDFGRGAHYSIMRAVCWHAPDLAPLSEAVLHDFAIIWDEDHDERIVPVIEKIYVAGLLAPILAIGERKGCLSVLVADEAARGLDATRLQPYQNRLLPLGQVDGDSWSIDVRRFGGESRIIDESDQDVEPYLRHINRLWKLGGKRPDSVALL